MTRHSFIPTAATEWLSLDTAAQWLDCPVQHVRTLAQSGKLRFRTSAGLIQIDSTSLDKILADRPVRIAQPEPETFVKVRGKAYREIATSRGTVLQKV